MDRKIEFLVSGIVEGESNYFRVIGRNCEDEILVGDCFESVYGYEDTVKADGSELAVRVHPVGLRLRVVAMHAYGLLMDVLGEGMTGALDLDGPGRESVHPDLMLGGEVVAANGQAQPSDAKSTSSS